MQFCICCCLYCICLLFVFLKGVRHFFGVFRWRSIDSVPCGLIDCTLYNMLCSARTHITHHLRLIGNVVSYVEVKTLLPGMMLHLMGESFKAEGNVLLSNFLVSASADTKVKLYKTLLAWGRGRGQSIK